MINTSDARDYAAFNVAFSTMQIEFEPGSTEVFPNKAFLKFRMVQSNKLES